MARIESSMHVEGFFDPATFTITYLLLDVQTRECAIIDSVLDYDPKSGRTGTATADRLIARIGELKASVRWILETHVHADHLSAAAYLKEKIGGRVAIGARVVQVQQFFGQLFNADPDFMADGRAFDHLLGDDEIIHVGALQLRAMHTPGHTPACMTYLVSDGVESAAFIGDTLFMPDYGTARCDFPGGDAQQLYQSIRKILSLPADTKLYMCHDYLPSGRGPLFVSSVAEERAGNVHIHDGIDEAAFVAMRRKRDTELAMPVLILPSVQVNMRAGRLPDPESNGTRYLKIPLNVL